MCSVHLPIELIWLTKAGFCRESVCLFGVAFVAALWLYLEDPSSLVLLLFSKIVCSSLADVPSVVFGIRSKWGRLQLRNIPINNLLFQPPAIPNRPHFGPGQK